MTAIRAVAGGKSYLSPAICDRVVSGYLGNRSGNGQSVPTQGIESLTGREREVLKLVAEGHRTRQIAEFLSLSTKTVEKHRSNLMRKLGAQNAASLAAYAINNGFTRP